MLADEAACRAAADVPGPSGPNGVAAADAVLNYLRPVRVGPVEARCSVLGSVVGRTVVRVAIHDLGSGGRMTNLGTMTVLAGGRRRRATPGPRPPSVLSPRPGLRPLRLPCRR